MPSLLDIQCSAIFAAACSADIGIVVRTDAPLRARQALYKFRQAVADPAYADIHIRVSPNDPEGEIWIMRRQAVQPTLSSVDLL